MLTLCGTQIKKDVIESFKNAFANPENAPDAGIIWDWVSSDMHMDLGKTYNSNYIDECFDLLVDRELAK
jgi:hypothetical protein